MNSSNEVIRKDASIIEEAKFINSNLKRASQQLKVSVMQADSTVGIIEQDGYTIKNALDEHKYELKGALRSTNQRLSQLKNSAIYEKYYLTLSLIFFVCTVIYIILKRTGILMFIMYLLPCATSLDL